MKIHLLRSGWREDYSACGKDLTWSNAGLVGLSVWKAVTCGNCQQTRLYKGLQKYFKEQGE
jgi:hypothetical protein